MASFTVLILSLSDIKNKYSCEECDIIIKWNTIILLAKSINDDVFSSVLPIINLMGLLLAYTNMLYISYMFIDLLYNPVTAIRTLVYLGGS